MAVHYLSRYSRLARAIDGDDNEKFGRVGRRDLSSGEKRIARNLAHRGYTTEQIAREIGWKLTVDSLRKKLRKINIHPASDKMPRRFGLNGETK
jgi:hypothetical protein